MRFYKLRDWILTQINIKRRLQTVCLWYLLSLMLATRKHSLNFASTLSGLNKSQFSKFLNNHHKTAVYTLESLSKKQAKIYAETLKELDSLPWRIAILIDSTIQHRSSLHSDNVKRFNHGKGFVIGHQWTNVILIINGIIIPLPPIPFYSKKYCRENKLKYKTENERVVEYLNELNLEEYIGPHISKDVVVIADSGYDDKKIQNTIIGKEWNFIIALKSTRGVKSKAKYVTTAKSTDWDQIASFFKNQRRLAWQTVRIFTNGPKRKRMDFRIRHTTGYLKGVGEVQLVCSEFKKRPDGRRKFIACTDLKVKAKQILIGYRLRWAIEIFHKQIKMHLGFEDVATKSFHSVEAHVHLVYCAYILLHAYPSGIPEGTKTIPDKQHNIMAVLNNKEIACILQGLTRIDGVNQYKNELKMMLADKQSHNPLLHSMIGGRLENSKQPSSNCRSFR